MISLGFLVDCVIGSPPYWNLRDYGIEPIIWDGDPECDHDFKINITKVKSWEDNSWKWISDGEIIGKNNNFTRWDHETKKKEKEIKEGFCSKCRAWKGTLGLEPNFELFIKHLCDIYDLIWKVLKKTGTCWVNLGDSYGGSGNSSGHTSETKNLTRKTSEYGASKGNQKTTRKYAKCLLMLPQRFAIEMVNRGWILRNVIIWHKSNCMPSSAKDRFTVNFEYVYFFVKSNKTQYWINEKTRKSISTKPLGTKGIEGIDWEWRKCEKCLGTGIKHKKCKFCAEAGWYYDEFLRPRKCPKCRGLGRIKMDSECKSCKGKGIKKYNFWKGKQYFFEQQRERLSQNPATQERYQYKVGNQTNRKDNGVDKVKPGKAFSQHFPQDLPKQVHDTYLAKITRKKPLIKGTSKESGKGSKKSGWNEYLLKNKDKLYVPLGRNMRTVWKIPTKANPETHFATFPPSLVKPMILSGCPEFICKECGKPREKVIETKYDFEKDSKGNLKPITKNKLKDEWDKSQYAHYNRYEYRAKRQGITKGYSDCGCNAGFRSGIVLDPFAGIGTTLLTAWNLGRNYIGFDISKEYCKIANKKLDITKYIRLDNFIEEKIEV